MFSILYWSPLNQTFYQNKALGGVHIAFKTALWKELRDHESKLSMNFNIQTILFDMTWNWTGIQEYNISCL